MATLARMIAAAILAHSLDEDKEIAELTEENYPVSSSAIDEIGWRSDGVITVTFKRGGSRTYSYAGTYELFLAFLASPSKGEFFNEHFQAR